MANDDITASDGLPARRNGAWAKDKLSFIDEFVPPALKATARMHQRYYVDLFAGPGKNIDENTGEEFDGAALRALRLTAPADERLYFTHARLVNLDREHHAALAHRIAQARERGEVRAPERHVGLFNGDANQVVHRIMIGIPTLSYVFAVADITAPRQLPWSTVRALKEHDHRSVDLLVLFPLNMGINRLLPYGETTPENSVVLDRLYGCDEWRSIYEDRVTDAQSRRMRERLLELYLTRLRSLGWAYAFVTRHVRRVGDAQLYKMIYASNHPAGEGIAAWSANRGTGRDQMDLGL